MDTFKNTDQVERRHDTSEGISSGIRATWAGMASNVVLIVFKLWAGFASNSQALIADGVHSISDLFSDFVVLLGLKWGRKGEDEDHPWGHARIETISSMVIGVMLLLIGLGIAWSSVSVVAANKVSKPGEFAIFAAAISIFLKEGLFWYTLMVGRRLKSQALIANAWHHRTDALSSVAVLIGVGAAYFNPDWYLADSLAALVVTVFVMKVGVDLVWSAFKELSDIAPDKDVIAGIIGVAGQVDGVHQVHDVRARYSGPQIFVELDIVVDADLTVRLGHDIAVTVKQAIMHAFPDITHVKIHVDPDLKPI